LKCRINRRGRKKKRRRGREDCRRGKNVAVGVVEGRCALSLWEGSTVALCRGRKETKRESPPYFFYG